MRQGCTQTNFGVGVSHTTFESGVIGVRDISFQLQLKMIEIDWISILKNVGIVLCGALIFPILVTIALHLIGFTSVGIVGGSIAASSMSHLGPIEAGSTFASIQSVSMRGFFALLINPCMLIMEMLAGLGTTVFLWLEYNFDTDRMMDEIFRPLLHWIAIALNYGLSLLADTLLCTLAGFIIGIAIGGIISLFRNKRSEGTPLLSRYSRDETDTESVHCVVVPILASIGTIAGITLAILYPYTIIPT